MAVTNGAFELWSQSSWPNVDVVGESHYKSEIQSLLPPRLNGGAEVMVDAELLPEPRNRHDRHAVRVIAAGKHVGYLARDVARQYSPLFQQLTARGMTPTTRCRVYGHETTDFEVDRRGRTRTVRDVVGSASVVLDPPHLCIPSNLPPASPHRLLPVGNALQLKGEDDHLDVLTPLVARHGESAVYATLHALAPSGSRSSKRTVEVRVDDNAIGYLTPGMSEHYLVVIDRLNEADHAAAARVYLTGNALKVEATLRAERSHQLDAEWLGGLPRPVLRTATPSERTSAPAPSTAVVTAVADTSGPPRTIAEMSPAFGLPVKPTRIIFNVPPEWPAPPPGWEPPPGWSPPGDWPAPPDGWLFWVADRSA